MLLDMIMGGGKSPAFRGSRQEERKSIMGAAEEFPVLIGSKNVSPIILDFLEAIRAGSSDKVAISTRLSSRLDAGALKRIPDLVEALLGGEHPEFAKVLHRLAIMHHSRGDFVGAEV